MNKKSSLWEKILSLSETLCFVVVTTILLATVEITTSVHCNARPLMHLKR